MPPLHLRQEFPTLRHFKEALHAWAIESHFEPRILKSDTGRVRVGCKRDPNCPFVIRCNWERKNGREPLARVTVLKDRHTCLNGLLDGAGGDMSGGQGGGGGGGVNEWGGMGGDGRMDVPQLEIRTGADGSVIGGARVLGPISRPPAAPASLPAGPLPKVQRNSASRLPFLMEILPRLMQITKETTPMEIRECLMREYGAEVHLQQCRRAKTEILKRQDQNTQAANHDGEVDGLGSSDNDTNHNAPMFNTQNTRPAANVEIPTPRIQTPATMHVPPPIPSSHLPGGSSSSSTVADMGGGGGGGDFPLHTASGVVIPQATPRRDAALNAVGEQPIRCPYCVNHRWMRTVRDAVEHMSMHVVV